MEATVKPGAAENIPGAGGAPEHPYGSAARGSRYQGQRGPTASRSWQNFHRTEIPDRQEPQ
ncbi:hypothetical protein ACFWQ6_21465 [Streptomyces coelicoflavus]|uniref:hypothetical protein n=1 Tax=Streptomyces coelicoflavus TaxID=285562 RepID=UPI003661C3BD